MSKIKNNGGTKLPGQVVRDVLFGTSDEVKAALPSCKNLKAQVRRYRKKINNVPANPQSAALLQIPPDYRTTNGDEFLLHEDCVTEAGKRILIFGSNLVLESRNSHIDALFVDGTFKSCPTLFKQVMMKSTVISSSVLILYY